MIRSDGVSFSHVLNWYNSITSNGIYDSKILFRFSHLKMWILVDISGTCFFSRNLSQLLAPLILLKRKQTLASLTHLLLLNFPNLPVVEQLVISLSEMLLKRSGLHIHYFGNSRENDQNFKTLQILYYHHLQHLVLSAALLPGSMYLGTDCLLMFLYPQAPSIPSNSESIN